MPLPVSPLLHLREELLGEAAEDLRAKLQELQDKLEGTRGVTSGVQEQNDFVRTSIAELDAMDPSAQRLA